MRTFTTVRTAAVLALMLVSATRATALVRGPDAAGYSGTDATVYSFIDVSAGGASVLAGTDDASAALTLPFSFTFYGHSYSMVCVSSNGAMYFVANAASCTGLNDFANIDLALTTPNDWPAVFPYWTDLTFQAAGAGSVFYQTIGTPGSRRFVVQWNNGLPASSSNAVTFQAILGEGTNNILFQYKTVTLGAGNASSNGAQATIGIRNTSGGANNNVIEWSFNAPVLRDGVAIQFNPPASAGRDTTPPVITSLVPSRTSIWPPNKAMVPVTIAVHATDAVTASPVCQVAAVSSNEPGSGQWQITDALVLTLQSDRRASGTGRIYTIAVTCTDEAGNTSPRSTTTVMVPHDQRK
jgi:hypothetical protein